MKELNIDEVRKVAGGRHRRIIVLATPLVWRQNMLKHIERLKAEGRWK